MPISRGNGRAAAIARPHSGPPGVSVAAPPYRPLRAAYISTLDGTICATHDHPVIKTFADKRAAALFRGHRLKGIPTDIQRRAQAKLALGDTAATVEDLRVPPGNRLEALQGDRE